MNIHQLEYIIAVDNFKHFGKAAAHCHVTQPTLSMMIQRLENELEVKIFDRSKKPVVTTEIGERVLEQARKILLDMQWLREMVRDEKKSIAGSLKIAMIPTLAPYLLPLFLKSYLSRFPGVQLNVMEQTTEVILDKLKKGQVDAGIMVTPLLDNKHGNRIIPLFYEEFLIYSSVRYKKRYLAAEDLDPNQLLLLEEGHCLRSQMLHLCAKQRESNQQFNYEAGSIETLIQLISANQGTTILPELAAMQLKKAKLPGLKAFKKPAPVREVSLVTHRDYLKRRLIDSLKEDILRNLPEKIRNRRVNKNIQVVPITDW